METYKRWVRSNKDFVHSFDSLANKLTWLLPERLFDSEIVPEAVSTMLGVITTINEHIMDTTALERASSSEPYSFPFPLCISALKELDTLVEVAARNWYGDEKKWNYIAIMEAIKAVVRLALFQKSGYKILLQGRETLNVESPEHPSTSDDRFDEHTSTSDESRSQLNAQVTAPSALSRYGENGRMVSEIPCLRRFQNQHAVMEPPELVKKPALSTILSEKGLCGALFMTGEVLFIIRPLVYVLFIHKYGLRSWKPWLISLGMDFTGMAILSRTTVSEPGNNARQFYLSISEKDEIRRRKLLWAFYLFRDPFFTKYTRQRLERTDKVLEPVPVIGFLTEKIIKIIIGAQTTYSYTSGS